MPSCIIIALLLLALFYTTMNQMRPIRIRARRFPPPSSMSTTSLTQGDLQARTEDLVLRALSMLGEFVLTHKLEVALAGLIATLEAAGRRDTAAALRCARDQLAQSIGQLDTRATRVGRARPDI